MYLEKEYHRECPANQSVGDERLENIMRRCACGRVTLLDMPCAQCGGRPQEPALEGWNESRDRLSSVLSRKMIGSGVAILAALIGIGVGIIVGIDPIGWISAVLLSVIAMAAAAALSLAVMLRLKLGNRTDEEHLFWLLHKNKKMVLDEAEYGLGAVDRSSLEPILDAYYLDLANIEAQADLAVRTHAGVDTVAYLLQQTDRLSHVFSNARLSRLQMRLLMEENVLGSGGLDVDFVCAHLRADDFGADELWPLMQYLSEFLVSGEYVDCENIKRLFEQAAVNVGLQRRQLQRPRRLLGSAVYKKIMSLCGEELFARVLDAEEMAEIRLPADEEKMGKLAKLISQYENAYHRRMLTDGSWLQLIYYLQTCGDEQFAAAGQTILEHCCGKPQEGELTLYDYVIQDKLYQCGDDLSRLLLPEERQLVGHVLTYCVYSSSGLCYNDIRQYGMAALAESSSYAYAEQQDAQWRSAPLFTAGTEMGAGV